MSRSRLKFSVTAPSIRATTQHIVEAHSAALDRIAAVSDPDFSNTFGALALADGEAALASAEVTFPALTHGDHEVRQASSQAKKELSGMWSRAAGRHDVLMKLEACSAAAGALGAQEERLVDVTLRRFNRAGAMLRDAAQRARFTELRVALADAELTFEQHINEDVTTVDFSTDQLRGLPDDFIAGLPRAVPSESPAADAVEAAGSERPCRVGLKAPQLVPVLKLAESEPTRRAMKSAAASRCAESNGPLLARMVSLRHELARMLGFSSHAAFQLSSKMAESPGAVDGFLRSVLERVEPQRERDMQELLDLKRESCGQGRLDDRQDVATHAPQSGKRRKLEQPESLHLEAWDTAFYGRILKERRFAGFDEELVRQYFPLHHVIDATLGIYQELLGVRFDEVGDAAVGGDDEHAVWHADVRKFVVSDAQNSERLGEFYIDLFSRDGKFGHQCVVPLRPSFVRPDGTRVLPACAILGNMGSSTPSSTLLRFEEVKTLFHEFGHVCHAVLARTDFSALSWAWPMVPWPGGVEQDFLEVPSMAFEQWVFSTEVLARLSSHHERPGEALPAEMIECIRRSKHFLGGISRARFLAMALFDMAAHTDDADAGSGDLAERFRSTYEAVTGFDLGSGTNYPASWYHLAIGYDAGYYGYLWSEVFAYDIVAAFKASPNGGYLDASLGRKFRDTCLEPCASKSGKVMLNDFLGREPSADAFFAELGLDAKANNNN